MNSYEVFFKCAELQGQQSVVVEADDTLTNGSLDIDGFGHVIYSPSENALLVAGGYLKRVH